MRFIQRPDVEQLEALRPQKGDLIECQGTEYVAEEIGMRYIVAHIAGNPAAKRLLRSAECSKVIAVNPPVEEAQTDLLKEFPSLARK